MSPIITNPTIQAITASAVALPLLLVSFMLFEPALVLSQSDDTEFIITQSIDTQISISEPLNVSMGPGIDGLTGGASTGTTTFEVATNSASGYAVAITFADIGTATSSGNAMIYNSNTDFSIGNGPTAMAATLPVPGSGQPSQFAFTVDSDQAPAVFRNTAGVCGSGTTNGVNCFIMNTTLGTGVTIMESNTASAGGSGDEASLHFRVVVGPNANPVVPNGTYTATATLTATVQ